MVTADPRRAIQGHTAMAVGAFVRVLLVMAAAVMLLACSLPCQADPSADTALVLYDGTGEWGWLGELYAQGLTNLLGHFPLEAVQQPVEQYLPGQMHQYRVAFYFGSVYDSDVPQSFLDDVLSDITPVCWFKYNLWMIAHSGPWTPDPDFESYYGFRFVALDWSPWDRVSYRGGIFTREIGDPELGIIEVLDPGLVEVPALAWQGPEDSPTDSTPYVIHSSNLWYVSDIPFAYLNESDRYLVFCDLLHDIVGIDHAETHRALVRIEDISADTVPKELRDVADYLYSRGAPFHMALVAGYRDPLLADPDVNVPFDYTLRLSDELIAAIRHAEDRGGIIIAHGFTHQWDSVPNPFCGRTGDDFEFYRVTMDETGDLVYEGPVPPDSEAWAQSRMTAALHELRSAGFHPVAWEVPHYAASQTDYEAFAEIGDLFYHRTLYFADAGPSGAAMLDLLTQCTAGPREAQSRVSPARDWRQPPRSSRSRGRDPFRGEVVVTAAETNSQAMLGQFFPYVIQQDVYGQKLAPENLDYIEPGDGGYVPRLPPEIITDAERNLAIRDGWASFYFHAFYDINYLKETVEGIQSLGYQFVHVAPDME